MAFLVLGRHGLGELAGGGGQGRAALLELTEVLFVVVRLGPLPAPPEDAQPLEGQRPQDRPVSYPLGPLLLVIRVVSLMKIAII